MRGTCNLCGNTSNFDKESLAASTIRINGNPVVMCVYCEIEAFNKIAKRAGINIKLDDDGDIIDPVKVKLAGLVYTLIDALEESGADVSYYKKQAKKLGI